MPKVPIAVTYSLASLFEIRCEREATAGTCIYFHL